MKRDAAKKLAERQLELFGKGSWKAAEHKRPGWLTGPTDKRTAAVVFDAVTRSRWKPVRWQDVHFWRGGMNQTVLQRYREQLRGTFKGDRDNFVVAKWKWLRWNINRDGSIELVDGRHRFTVAREEGVRFLPVKLRRIGASGRTLRTWTGVVKMETP